jgi:hypothetical protein
MLKSTFLTYHNVNLSDYGKLTPFLKQNAVSYKPKKAKIFLKKNMNKFLLTTFNNFFLMKKVFFSFFFFFFSF